MLTYSFYKIAIKGTKHCYIGSSKNFIQRMRLHKNSFFTFTASNHNLKLYEVMRQNGGWDNIEILVISTQDFETKEEALIQEQKYIVQYKSNLNMIPATCASTTCLIEMKEMTPRNSDENKKKRQRLITSIWKKTTGKAKYNEWQRNYMTKKQRYIKEAKIFLQCLLPEAPC